jgi:uncharacterized protein (AIM24 family)
MLLTSIWLEQMHGPLECVLCQQHDDVAVQPDHFVLVSQGMRVDELYHELQSDSAK